MFVNKRIFYFLILFFLLVSCKKNDFSNTELKNVSRIVSLSPASTEILCAIGAYDKIVARSDFCDYPPEVSKIPSVGGFDGKSLSLENILSFEPDFVYLTKGMHDHLISSLENQGIKVYVSNSNSIQAILDEILQIGIITNNGKNAEDLCNEIKKNISNIKYSYKNIEKQKVYWEIWAPPYISIGSKSFMNEMISIAGGKNIFNEVEQDYPIVSDEVIILKNPQIIFIPNTMKDGVNIIKNRVGWQNIDAVKNNRIYSMDADIISRPGPRVVQAISLISTKIHQ